MKESTVFEAYDGKVFHTKELCMMHELSLSDIYNFIKNIKFFYADGTLKELPSVEEFYTQKTFFSDVIYIVLPNDDYDYLNSLRNTFNNIGEEAKVSLQQLLISTKETEIMVDINQLMMKFQKSLKRATSFLPCWDGHKVYRSCFFS